MTNAGAVCGRHAEKGLCCKCRFMDLSEEEKERRTWAIRQQRSGGDQMDELDFQQ